jgi:hypothetical protein
MATLGQLSQYKRTGDYVLFVDESSTGRAATSAAAIHVLVGQSRFPAAPTNTLVKINDSDELHNTFGFRDKYMERRGCYLIPHAETLLQQGPIFILNLRPYDSTNTLTKVGFMISDDGWVSASADNKTVEYTSMFDRTSFWKLDSTKLDSMDTLLNFASFTNKNASILITKPDLSNTEFANKTVADYNKSNPRRTIDSVPAATLLTDLFVEVHVFARNLQNDLTSNLNPALGAYVEVINGSLQLKGANAAAKLANLVALKKLASADYVDAFAGSIVPTMYNAMNELVSIENAINKQSKVHGIVCRINRNIIDDWSFAVDSGVFDSTIDFTVDTTATKFAILTGVTLKASQLVDGTAARQNVILDLIATKGIKAGLNDFATYDYKYILDAFKSYIEPQSKFQLAKFAYDTKKVAFLYSVPFKKDFAAMEEYQNANGEFDSSYIPMGGNPNVTSSTMYSMPDGNNGDVATFPFAAGLIYDDGSDQTMIPANVLGALAYGSKHLSAFKKPYTIVNGEANSLVNARYIVDTEHFTNDDYDALEPFGWNFVVKNGSSFEIRNDATAKNIERSALSMASNYELLLYYAKEGEAVMKTKKGLRNNDLTRSTTQEGLSKIAQKLVTEGVLESYSIRCDEVNNSADVRKAGLLVADSDLWTADGIKITVHRLTTKLKQDSSGL